MLNLADPKNRVSFLVDIWDGTLFVPYIYFIDKTSSSCDHGENMLIFNGMIA